MLVESVLIDRRSQKAINGVTARIGSGPSQELILAFIDEPCELPIRVMVFELPCPQTLEVNEEIVVSFEATERIDRLLASVRGVR
ncbi:hypothetical protein LCGC14_0754540 [marine sediment metagenome]|uniref:Uncharacterized protein n=1 Tax=marine sediment metagenome TaxID=412755 RepID=A0A0F9Q785_9ZZZZ